MKDYTGKKISVDDEVLVACLGKNNDRAYIPYIHKGVVVAILKTKANGKPRQEPLLKIRVDGWEKSIGITEHNVKTRVALLENK